MDQQTQQHNGRSHAQQAPAPAPEALVYCRVSTKGQEENGTSLDSQERECIAHAAALDFTVGRITHEVYSGAELWDRPKLSRDRADLKAGRFAALICYATDRLSRDPIHLAILAEECERAGVALHFVSETFDNSDESALIRYVKGYSSKVERAKIRERSLRGKYQRAINGKVHNTGPELYGWRRDKQHGIRLVNKPEASVVRRLFTLILEGRSYHAIAQTLNAELVAAPGTARAAATNPTKRVYWTASSVMRIVRNPAYKGEAVAWRWHRAPKVGALPRKAQRPADEWIRLPAGVTPAIVPPEQWERAQEAAHKQVGDRTRNEQTPYLLRGLVFCAVCGRKMWPSWNRKSGWTGVGPEKYRTYRCSSYNKPTGLCGGRIANAEKLETQVWERVANRLRHPEVIAAELQRREEEGPDPILTDDLDKARRKVAWYEHEQRKLVAKLRTSEDSDTARSSRMWKLVEEEVEALEAEREQWQATITKIEGRLAEQQATTAQLAQVYASCDQWVSANLDRAGFDEQRLALEGLEVRVTANGREWDVEGSIPLDLPVDVVSPMPADWPRPRDS